MTPPLSSTAISKSSTTTFPHPLISPAGASDLSEDGGAEWSLGMMSFAEERRLAEESAKRKGGREGRRGAEANN
jgi:hypothetical protein